MSGGDAPPGVFNPPPTEGGARRAGLISSTSTSNTRHQHRMALLQVSHEIFVFPLSIISPQARPVHRSPAQKYRFLCLFRLLGSIFGPSQTRFKNDFEKTSKKVRKSRILASENPLKTFRKSIQNRCPNKHAIFNRFLLDFCSSLPRPIMVPTH